MRVWEGLLGILLLVLALGGWNRGGQVPVWQQQALGALAVCVGYLYTQGLWSGKHWGGAGEWILWVGLIGFLAVSLWCFLLFWNYRRGRNSARLVDLAGIGALWTWSVIALVTYGLLRVAGWHEPLSGPPYLPVLLLTLLSAILYSVSRFAYAGDRVQRVLLVALGLCTLVHVFR
jgi:hypothetical protein